MGLIWLLVAPDVCSLSFSQMGEVRELLGFFIVKTKVLPFLGLGLALSIELITIAKEC